MKQMVSDMHMYYIWGYDRGLIIIQTDSAKQ